MKTLFLTLLSCLIMCVTACKEDNPADSDGDTDSSSISGDPRNTCMDDAADAYEEELSSCEPAATDYQPRNADADSWDACISDDNTYHRFDESISSIARVEAYDAIGELLWNSPLIPSPQDFIDARILLDADEGLGSRVDRRYDIHYAPPADGSACDEEGVAAQYPDYCVGPGRLRPLINDAFADAADGGDPLVNAEIIHAALQWFLYVSPLKEGTTCAENAPDCDSCYAYYTGGTDRESPIGLADEINALSPSTHNRAYDAVLAVRCWRDLDAGTPATDLDLRDQAMAQLDASLLNGMAIIVRQRFAALAECTETADQAAALAGLNVLVPLLDRETRARDSDIADALLAEIEKDIQDIDVTTAIDFIDAIYSCP